MLKVFFSDVYVLLDLGVTLYFVTPCVAVRFDVPSKKLLFLPRSIILWWVRGCIEDVTFFVP